MAHSHRQNPALSEEAQRIRRGCIRHLTRMGEACLVEMPLPNKRRADIVSLNKKGQITIIEVKSGVPDFRADQKWPDYLAYCDAFYFAVDIRFPDDILPENTGFLRADDFGAEMMRESTLAPLKPARRQALIRSFARLSAFRLTALHDPRLKTGIITQAL